MYLCAEKRKEEGRGGREGNGIDSTVVHFARHGQAPFAPRLWIRVILQEGEKKKREMKEGGRAALATLHRLSGGSNPLLLSTECGHDSSTEEKRKKKKEREEESHG